MVRFSHPNFLFKIPFSFIVPIIFLSACSETEIQEKKPLFTIVDHTQTNIHFTNTIKEDLYFNFLNYSYIYNGAGVAVGDINNDGLEDLYFSSNQGSNKLYLNQGGFTFKDITLEANVSDEKGWSTGVSMIDVNNDGWLDIYVCKSGSLNSHEQRKNKLYINQTDNTFKESAKEYGLDHYGFSIQAYFFDYDNDADLDMYLVNHRQDFQNNTSINQFVQQNKEAYNSDQLFRNEGGFFSNVTTGAGIENKAWGLSASIGDFNNDHLLDVYVANDFLEPDFLYINQGDGTFKDEILQRFNHISANSMGSDFADINNDLRPDLIVLDMLAEDHIRSKENMASMSTANFNLLVNMGYHRQYMSNMLQLNNGNGTFSEIGQLAQIAKTDWSWAPLIADFDNDGFKDLFVTNGIAHDLSNQDFRNQMRNNIRNRKKVSLEEAINMMPSSKLSNYIFKNNTDLTFSNVTREWGLQIKKNTNGAIYADLDNDGDLDMVVNNQEDKAQIYQNNSANNYLVFSFVGNERNRNAIGSKVNVYANGLQQSKELFLSRGYQSSVTNKLHFGLGSLSKIDSVEVIWPNGTLQVLPSLKANTHITLEERTAKKQKNLPKKSDTLFEDIDPKSIGVHFKQMENPYNDFDLQLLLPQKQSEISNPMAVADVNNDGLDDFFVGNAKGAKAALFLQEEGGSFKEHHPQLFESEKGYEDTDAEFIDIDGDNDLDLYVTSGGYEFKGDDPLLQDRLYLNDGHGNYRKSRNLPKLFSNTKGIAAADYDQDGDMDIFVGGRVKHGQYPLADNSYLLENKNGQFTNVTSQIIPGVLDLQMVNDALFSDFDNDGDKDLIVVGEWMTIVFFENKNQEFVKRDMDSLKDIPGWYQHIVEADMDSDGHMDYVIGNWGDNTKFHPSPEKPLYVYADDFDGNATFDIALSKLSNGKLLPVRGKECSSEQTPFLNAKLKTYKEFASSSLSEIYGQEQLDSASRFKVSNFKSLILKNKGDGSFSVQELPNHAQLGPSLGIEVFDIDDDGRLDIFGVGNVYDAEVETIRYDASKGYILTANGKGGYTFLDDISYFSEKEVKAIKRIRINHETHFILLNKNSELRILRLKNKLLKKEIELQKYQSP